MAPYPEHLARHRRIVEHYAAETPEAFVRQWALVQRHGTGAGAYVVVTFHSWRGLCEQAGRDVLDGLVPLVAYDLDTGAKVELRVEVPSVVELEGGETLPHVLREL